MKHKKHVTDAVLAANRANSQSSTGPKTERGKSNSSKNALRHGILTRNVILDTHELREEFRKLKRYCREELRPKGFIERFLVEEIMTLFWKLGIVEPLIVEELLRRQECSNTDLDNLLHDDLEPPIGGYDLPKDRGWNCERLVVRSGFGKDGRQSQTTCTAVVSQGQIIPSTKNSHDSNHQNNANVQIEAVVGNALDNMTRYQARLKRDLYVAIDRLRKMQGKGR